MNNYPHLFQAGTIGHLRVRNRLVMPAMGTGLANARGEVTPELLAHYRRRSQGGVGTVIVEIACVDSPLGRAGFNQLLIDHPRYLSGLAALADTIKSGGARAFIQLHHAGRQTALSITEGLQPLAPSAIACRLMRVLPRAMTRDEIKHVEEKFIQAARLAKKAGFDGIELHAAHGYLLSEFLSPYTNQRDDEYGGDIERRFRIVREIVSGIRETLGDFPLSVRFNMTDFVPGGLTVEEGRIIARWLDECGVDLLNVTCGNYESGMTNTEPAAYPEGWRLYLARAANEEVRHAAVVAGGTIRTPELADEIIASGSADLVWLGRPLLADPEWPAKLASGQPETVRPCLSCNVCMQHQMNGLPVRCSVNPDLGRDNWPDTGSVPPRRVLVAGGGPAGMQAALSLSRRGHQVILVEEKERLGGLLLTAAVPPHKEKLGDLARWLIGRLRETPVEVRLDTPLTAALLEEIRPEVLILAWGSRPVRPQIPGCHIGIDVGVLLDKGLSDQMVTPPGPSGHLKTVVIGGAASGLEAASYLAAAGHQVTVVEASSQLGAGMENMTLLTLFRDLKKTGVTMLKNSQVTEVGPGEVMIENDGVISALAYDVVVWATGYNPPALPDFISNYPGQLMVVGDASGSGDILHAITQGDWCKYQVV